MAETEGTAITPPAPESGATNTVLSNNEIQGFLASKQALLVHFSTVMARRDDLLFPNDLERAATLSEVAPSFSTIQKGDTPPGCGKGGAEGSVGIVVKLNNSSGLTPTLRTRTRVMFGMTAMRQ